MYVCASEASIKGLPELILALEAQLLVVFSAQEVAYMTFKINLLGFFGLFSGFKIRLLDRLTVVSKVLRRFYRP